MNFSAFQKRVVVSALMAIMAIGAIAPAAFAGQGRGHGNKYRRGEVGYQSQGQYRSYGGYRGNSYPTRSYRTRSNAAPVIAGIIGGIAIGALLTSNSHPAYAQQQYRYDDEDVYYVDPYSDRTYASLNVYVGNTQSCNYPRLVRVMDRRSNRCLRTIRYSQDGWSDCGRGYGGYSDSYYDGYGGGYDRGGYDRGGYDRGGYDRGYGRGQGRGECDDD